MRNRPILRTTLALAALLTASCGSGNRVSMSTSSTTSSTPSSSSTTSTTSSTPTSAGVPEGPGTYAGGAALPIEKQAGTTRAYLKAVRVAGQAGFDRVVFETEDAHPGYAVRTATRPITEDGSGKPVMVDGAALLEVRLENAATARVEGRTVTVVYQGAKRIESTGTGIVTEAVDIGDFEGVVTWIIGLEQTPASVRITTLANPNRLVLDIPTG